MTATPNISTLSLHDALPILGDKSEEIWCAGMLALVARDQSDYARARSFHEQALSMAREAGYELDVAGALDGMGYTAYLDGDLETGQSLLEESLQILRKGRRSPGPARTRERRPTILPTHGSPSAIWAHSPGPARTGERWPTLAGTTPRLAPTWRRA